MSVLTVEHLKKTYESQFAENRVEALRDISFTVEENEFIAIMGESGSGKTTLLNILATLDVPSAGSVLLNGKDLFSTPEQQRADYRRTHLGFVFQEFNLLDTLSVEDNICLPLVLSEMASAEIQKRLSAVAYTLNIQELLAKFPYEISGGQRQRTAVARAIITNPALLLADEPTGALDSRSASELLQLFDAIHHAGQTILMVTHSARAASCADRVLFIKDGLLHHQIYRGSDSIGQLYRKIVDTLTALETGGGPNA